MEVLGMALLLEKSLREYDKRSFFPWVNWYRQGKKYSIINKFFVNNLDPTKEINYDLIRELAELYNYLHNGYRYKLDSIKSKYHSQYIYGDIYYKPSILRVRSEDDCVIIKIRLDLDKELSNKKHSCIIFNEYEFMFMPSNISIQHKSGFDSKDTLVETISCKYSLEEMGTLLQPSNTIEWDYFRMVFTQTVIQMLIKYFNDSSRV